MFRSLNIPGSALTAERFRMDIIANNMANAQSTQTQAGGPYQRRSVSLQPMDPRRQDFQLRLSEQLGGLPLVGAFAGGVPAEGGVEVASVRRDPTPPELDYDPEHPDADEDGYVAYPNVNVLKEMTDLMAVSRSYQANSAVFDANKNMIITTTQMGR